MANLHVLLDHTWKSRISKISIRCQIWGVHSITFHLELRNERFILISFRGFPTILNMLQPFQICIFNRQQSKLTSSNGPQPMGRKLMSNLHVSLDHTQKSRISKNSTRCQILGGSIQQLLILNSEMHSKHFPNQGGSIPQLFILNSEMKGLH